MPDGSITPGSIAGSKSKNLGIPGDRIVDPADKWTIPRILLTISTMESGRNYTAQAKNASASGAYQFVDGTWKAQAAKFPDVAKYAHAKDAPPDLQDRVAEARVREILAACGDQLGAVPVNWYYPAAWTDPTKLDLRPPGNAVTIREYATRWIAQYDKIQTVGLSDLPGQIAGGAGAVVGDAISSVVGWTEALGRILSNLLSPAWWKRLGIGALGVGLVVIAAVALVASSDTFKNAAKVAAVA